MTDRATKSERPSTGCETRAGWKIPFCACVQTFTRTTDHKRTEKRLKSVTCHKRWKRDFFFLIWVYIKSNIIQPEVKVSFSLQINSGYSEVWNQANAVWWISMHFFRHWIYRRETNKRIVLYSCLACTVWYRSICRIIRTHGQKVIGDSWIYINQRIEL